MGLADKIAELRDEAENALAEAVDAKTAADAEARRAHEDVKLALHDCMELDVDLERLALMAGVSDSTVRTWAAEAGGIAAAREDAAAAEAKGEAIAAVTVDLDDAEEAGTL